MTALLPPIFQVHLSTATSRRLLFKATLLRGLFTVLAQLHLQEAAHQLVLAVRTERSSENIRPSWRIRGQINNPIRAIGIELAYFSGLVSQQLIQQVGRGRVRMRLMIRSRPNSKIASATIPQRV